MSDLIRFGVSIDRKLIEPFDRLIDREEYNNRSEAIRDLIRERLVQEEELTHKEMFGALTLVYNHHQRGLESRLTDIQHHAAAHVISSLHVHVDPENCMQILVLHGPARELRILASRLKALRGVKHATLSLTTTGTALA